MITFTELGNYGRLGNLLFQYAALKSLAKKLNCEAKIPPDLDSRCNSGQLCLLNCFKINCNVYTETEIANLPKYEETCQGGSYDLNFWNCKENTNLFGYFESELYFEHIKDEIKKEYELKDDISNYANNYLHNIRCNFPGHEIIGLHFRRGDFVQINSQHCSKTYNNNFLDLVFNLFNDIPLKLFLVFSGGSPKFGNNNGNDLLWCKNLLLNRPYTFLFSENNNTIQDFSIMTKCDHFITNSMSSIAWWAGYLNKNINKRIVAPDLGYKNFETYWYNSVIKIPRIPIKTEIEIIVIYRQEEEINNIKNFKIIVSDLDDIKNVIIPIN